MGAELAGGEAGAEAVLQGLPPEGRGGCSFGEIVRKH